MSEYVVIGAGISALYTTYCLINDAHVDPKSIEIISEHLPGDTSINYTSPWAGGNFSTITPDDDKTLQYDKYTYTHLGELQSKLGGPQVGLDNKFPATEYWESYPSAKKLASLKTYVKNLKVLSKAELPEGALSGISYSTWNFNCPFFLANFRNWLESQGVKFTKKKLDHIAQAWLPHTKVVVNCTGIGAFSLSGVKDTKVYPTRGQIVIVRAPHIKQNLCRWGDNYATYIIPRPYSHDQLILGGFMHKGSWDGDTHGEMSRDIIKRTTELLPEILDRPLEILTTAAGLRPSREGGPRIEVERTDGKLILHNYGAGGFGYQAGLGMAHHAVQLLIQAQREYKL